MGWNEAQIASLYTQAAKDGFTVVNSQLLWYDVEKTKDVFDWTILDSLIATAEANHLKLEILWFGTQSDGCVQYVGVNNTGHLRVPDYVLTVTNGTPKSPYQLAKNADGTLKQPRAGLYQMEMSDDSLIARERFVLSQISAHIAAYDASHGNLHTVVGFQILNEAHVGGNSTRSHAAAANALFTSGGFTSETTFNRFVNQRYISGIAAGIKSSGYSVWTRANLHGTSNWIGNNESARNNGGTNLDFLGPDGFVPDAPSVMNSVVAHGYAVGKNFAMIMETGGIHSGQATFPIAALAGNTAYNVYHFVDLTSSDAFYIRSGTTFSPSGSYVATVRSVNLMLAKDRIDLATKKNKSGLFVYNAVASSTSTVTGLESIRFTPASTTDQGIAIRRSGTEIVLMSTGRGSFQIPSSAINVSSAGVGSFDESNSWVQTATKAAPLSGGFYNIDMNSFDVVRVSSGSSPGGTVIQAESATLGGGAAVENHQHRIPRYRLCEFSRHRWHADFQ